MRRPSLNELDREQREILQADDDEETILVIGPPGSGKTILALARAEYLKRDGQEVTLCVFNRVLHSYMDAADGQPFVTWLKRWWRRATGKNFPIPDGGRPWDLDYERAIELLDTDEGIRKRIASKERHNWGHLILDEAQDFPPDAHRLLRSLQRCFPKGNRPCLMILADENQRLTDASSSLTEIRNAHVLDERDVYSLRKNYRNTRPIAEFAKQFFVGAASGIPELPDREGEPPEVIAREDMTTNRQVEKIANWATNNQHEDVAVLVPYEKTRSSLFNRLKAREARMGVQVQTYTSNRARLEKGGFADGAEMANALKFDGGGTITVLCFASAKGLEFDTVFVPEVQKLNFDSGESLVARMNLYVMASRARSKLALLGSDLPPLFPAEAAAAAG